MEGTENGGQQHDQSESIAAEGETKSTKELEVVEEINANSSSKTSTNYPEFGGSENDNHAGKPDDDSKKDKGDTDREKDANEPIAVEKNTKSAKERLVEENTTNLNDENSETSKNSPKSNDSEKLDQKRNNDSKNEQALNVPSRERLAKHSFPHSKSVMDEPAKEKTSEALTAPTTDEITKVEDKNSSPAITLSNFCVDLSLKPNLKFTLTKARTVDNHTLTAEELTCPDQIPEYILKTLMIVNYHAREFELKPLTSDKNKTRNGFDSDESEDEDKTKDGNEDRTGIEM